MGATGTSIEEMNDSKSNSFDVRYWNLIKSNLNNLLLERSCERLCNSNKEWGGKREA